MHTCKASASRQSAYQTSSLFPIAAALSGTTCRLLRHDMVAELCESAIRFKQAGGTASALPKGASSGRALLPGGANGMSLHVYGDVEVQDLVVPKFGPGIEFQLQHQTQLMLWTVLSDLLSCNSETPVTAAVARCICQPVSCARLCVLQSVAFCEHMGSLCRSIDRHVCISVQLLGVPLAGGV